MTTDVPQASASSPDELAAIQRRVLRILTFGQIVGGLATGGGTACRSGTRWPLQADRKSVV